MTTPSPHHMPRDGARAADPQWFRRVLGHYPTGVAVVTALGPDRQPEGMVVGSFTSVSLDPPMVAFLPSATSRTWKRIRATGRFCVNILDADREHLCRQFATSGGDKFDGVPWHAAASGSPIIDGAVAWIDCETDTVHEAGDHHIVVGRVLDLDTASEGHPLLFFQGGYGSFTPHTMVASDERFTSELSLVDRARPLLEGTARGIGGQIAVAHCDDTTFTVLAVAGQARNHRLPTTAIGQTVTLAAPVGIWWMSYAESDAVEHWLRSTDPRRRNELREAMRLIRADNGLTAGLSVVHDSLGTLLEEHPSNCLHHATTDTIPLTDPGWQPLDFVASRVVHDGTAADHPEVRSIWAPVLDETGHVVLGVMVTGYPDDRPLADMARAVRHVALSMGSLCAPQDNPRPTEHSGGTP